jgi:hypothetical protein
MMPKHVALRNVNIGQFHWSGTPHIDISVLCSYLVETGLKYGFKFETRLKYWFTFETSFVNLHIQKYNLRNV